MKKAYSISELINFAVEIEKQGALFYENMAKRTTNESVRKLYEFLKAEELIHRHKYQEMLNKVDSAANDEHIYTDEYHQYLNSMVESIVFRKDEVFQNKLTKDNEVIDYAIIKEKESILLYMEMRLMIKPEQQSIVDEIIKEEKSHIVKLLDLKQKVA